LTLYFLIGKQVSASRPPIGMLIFGFGFASAFWLIVLPPWNFPFEVLTHSMQLQGTLSAITVPGWVLVAYVVIFGTIVPYLCVTAGLRLLSASTTSVIGMLEPVLAGAFAWIILGQSWDLIQLSGAAIVLIGIYIADRSKNVVA
jgi:drug/metabolite transporter (DMT)-like permease